MAAVQLFPLCDLANELIICVLEQLYKLDDPATLRNLTLTCHRIRDLAEPYIYRSIFLRTGNEATALLAAITSRQSRSKAISSIDARGEYMKHEGFENLADVIRAAEQLKVLTIESPFTNDSRWELTNGRWEPVMDELLEPFQEAIAPTEMSNKPLQALTTLTLHLNGDMIECWDLSAERACIFSHPTLQDLTISCANIGQDSFPEAMMAPKTPLRRLKLEECNISMQGIARLLLLPTALEHLHLGENYHGEDLQPFSLDEPCNQLCEKWPAEFFAALSSQRHSLVSLAYSPREHQYAVRLHGLKYRRVSKVSGPGLSTFAKLEDLTSMRVSSNMEGMLAYVATSPPNLKRLTLATDCFTRPLGDDEVVESAVRLARLKQSLPKLEDLVIRENVTLVRTAFRMDMRGAISMAHTFLRQACVKLNVQVPASSSFVPPILYGESAPEYDVIYDSTDGFAPHLSTPFHARVYAESSSEWEDLDGDESTEAGSDEESA